MNNTLTHIAIPPWKIKELSQKLVAQTIKQMDTPKKQAAAREKRARRAARNAAIAARNASTACLLLLWMLPSALAADLPVDQAAIGGRLIGHRPLTPYEKRVKDITDGKLHVGSCWSCMHGCDDADRLRLCFGITKPERP